MNVCENKKKTEVHITDLILEITFDIAKYAGPQPYV